MFYTDNMDLQYKKFKINEQHTISQSYPFFISKYD